MNTCKLKFVIQIFQRFFSQLSVIFGVLLNPMKKKFPSFETARLLLRQIHDDDQDNVYHGLSNPGVTRYYGIRFDTKEAAREQMKWFSNLEMSGKGLWWTICSRDGSIFYGAGGLNGIDKTHKKAEAGFWLLPEHWGKGIMKEAFPLICNYGFDCLGLHRIEGYVEPENLNCKKVLKKLNFRHDGTMEQKEIKNGKFIDIEIHALFNQDKTAAKD